MKNGGLSNHVENKKQKLRILLLVLEFIAHLISYGLESLESYIYFMLVFILHTHTHTFGMIEKISLKMFIICVIHAHD